MVSLRYFLVMVFLFLLLSCSKSSVKLFSKKPIVASNIDSSLIASGSVILDYPTNHNLSDLHLKYLGSGGYYIGNKDSGVLIDPFFSPYKMVPLAVKKIVTIPENVDKGLADIQAEIIANAKGIFVTHSHYDHLLDVPYVFNQYLASAQNDVTIYGSSSVKAIINAVVDSTRIVNIEEDATAQGLPGKWVYMQDSTLRVMPVFTVHAPHYKKIVSFCLYGGDAEPIKHYTDELTPTHVNKWKEGKTFAYLIDFLDNDEPYFRIYLLSSSSAPPNGFIEESILQEHRVNLAILGAASFANVENYPSGILAHIRPEKVLLAHWEDLFKPYLHNPPRLIRATNFKVLLPKVNAAFPWKVNGQQRLYMPYPGTHIRFTNSGINHLQASGYPEP